MNEERRLNLVLAELRDDTSETRQTFIEGMAKAFHLKPEQLDKILENLPFVLSRECTLDEARAMAEKVQGVGGVCRLQDPSQEEPAPSPPPKQAPQPQPEEAAAEPEAAPSPSPVEEKPDQEFDMPGPDQSAGAEDVKVGLQPQAPSSPAPEPKVEPAPTPKPKAVPAPAAKPATESEPTPGTIPLAIPGAGAGGSAAPPKAGEVKCIECGEVQPGGATCRSCYFPLPER